MDKIQDILGLLMRDRARSAVKIQHRVDNRTAARLGIGNNILQAAAFRLIKRVNFRSGPHGPMLVIPTERLIGVRAVFVALAAKLRFIYLTFAQRIQQGKAGRASPASAVRQWFSCLVATETGRCKRSPRSAYRTYKGDRRNAFPLVLPTLSLADGQDTPRLLVRPIVDDKAVALLRQRLEITRFRRARKGELRVVNADAHVFSFRFIGF